MTAKTSSRASTRGPYAKTAQRKQDIIDAATNVFAASGYHGGSLRDISRQLDISLTTVVHHFQTKEDLLIAVLENADHTGADWLPQRIENTGFVKAFSDLVATNYSRPELLRLFTVLSAEASAPGHPAHEWFVTRYRRAVREIAKFIQTDQDLGRVASSINATDAAKIVIGAWDGLQLQWLLDPSEDMAARMGEVFARVLGVDSDEAGG